MCVEKVTKRTRRVLGHTKKGRIRKCELLDRKKDNIDSFDEGWRRLGQFGGFEKFQLVKDLKFKKNTEFLFILSVKSCVDLWMKTQKSRSNILQFSFLPNHDFAFSFIVFYVKNDLLQHFSPDFCSLLSTIFQLNQKSLLTVQTPLNLHLSIIFEAKKKWQRSKWTCLTRFDLL